MGKLIGKGEAAPVPAVIASWSKFCPTVKEHILEALRNNQHKKYAAESAGVSWATFKVWQVKGQEELEECEKTGLPPAPGGYGEFYAQVVMAVNESLKRNLKIIQQEAEGGVLIKEVTRTLKDGTVEVTREYSKPQWLPAAWLVEREFELYRQNVLESTTQQQAAPTIRVIYPPNWRKPYEEGAVVDAEFVQEPAALPGSEAASPPPGTDGSPPAGETVQFSGGGPEMA